MLKDNYNASLHWNITSKCNLNCSYCFSNMPEQNIIKRLAALLKKQTSWKLRQIEEKAAEIDIPSLVTNLGRMNRTFRIDFTGGEPFMIPNFVETCEQITKKHFISFSTNLTSDKIRIFTSRIDPARVINIVASLHIKELERLGLTDRYVDNFMICKNMGFNIHALEVAYPPLLEEAQKYKCLFEKRGIELQYSPFCGIYNGKQYPGAYSDEELQAFGINKSEQQVFYQKGKYCNAGYNIAVVLRTGEVQPCYNIKKKMGNIYDVIKFNNEINACAYEYCFCPLNIHDRYLYEKAIKII